jgi:DNA adenine methylase
MKNNTGELSPILKWPGGKERELKYILPNLPGTINRYYEPFVGGGAVYTTVEAKEYFIFDNTEQFNGMFAENFNFDTSNFLTELQINLFRKIVRMKTIERRKTNCRKRIF